MTARCIRYAYGPVPSRRLGMSLGINNIPAKACTFSCVYCQVGPTLPLRNARSRFFDPEDIVRDVRTRLAEAKAAAQRVDFLTFVPNGEPTLDLSLGKEIMGLKGMQVPVGVITNSSLLWRDDVREELCKADWVSLKIDAVQKGIWRQINRPHKLIRLSQVLEGMTAFAKVYGGELVTETMLVRGLNDCEECMNGLSDFIAGLRPSKAYLSIPTRPPAEAWVRGPAEDALHRACRILAGKVEAVECLNAYEGDAFAFSGDIEEDLLDITAVHPMRREAVSALLLRAGSSWEVVDRLVAQGKLEKRKHRDDTYYIRRLKKDRWLSK